MLNEYLEYACKVGRTEDVKLLLSKGADVHAYNDYSLRCASLFGHIEVVKLLLNAGANVHAYHDDALAWAKYKGHTEVVKLLKKYMEGEENVKN